MKKILAFCLMIVFVFVFVFPVSVLAETNINSVDTYAKSDEYDLIEYDYINKTERIISADEVYDYSAVTSTTYELSNMASSLENNVSKEASTFNIIDPNASFDKTSPTDSNGNPVAPYSGVMYLMIGVNMDFDSDGIVDMYVADYSHGTGFLVAPDVLVTAAHCICLEEHELASVRVYYYHHRAIAPSATHSTDYVYPSQWVYSTAYSNNFVTDKATASKYDWCVMKLQEDIVGAYNFSCTYNSVQLNDAVSLSGYADSPLCTKGPFFLCNFLFFIKNFPKNVVLFVVSS